MYTLTGMDDDGDTLTFAMNSNYFAVNNAATGEVTLTQRLDYEVADNYQNVVLCLSLILILFGF